MRVVTNNERMESIRDNAVNVMEIIEVVRAVHEDGIKPGPGFVSQLDEAIMRLNDIVDDSKESITQEISVEYVKAGIYTIDEIKGNDND